MAIGAMIRISDPDSPGKIFNTLLTILVYSSAFYFFSFVTADTDLWGHIKFGKDMWISRGLHYHDLYSYTAYGREWINHEWLSELLMYLVYHAFGSPGLLIGKLMVGFAIILLLSRITSHRTHTPFVYCLVFVLCAFVMSPGFMVRPQLFTYLFTALFLYVFYQYLEREKNLLWSLPLIMVLWVNCHGGSLIGLGMFPVVVVSEAISCHFKKRDGAYLKALFFWMIITEVTVFINPYGYHLWVFLYETISIPRNISEWYPISIFNLSYLRFKLLALLFLGSFFIQNKERRSWEVAIIVIVLIYAFRHQRHSPILGIVAAPYLTENLSLVAQRIGLTRRIRSFPSYLILSIFLSTLVGYQLFATSSKYFKARFNIIVDPFKYPVYAVHFLKENRIKGNILLPFEWGEYVIWKLYPHCKVSIDGRFRTVYSEVVLDDHLGAFEDGVGFRRLLDKYPPDIILARQNLSSQELVAGQGDWVYVYSDRVSIVFIRNADSQKDVLERFRKKELIYPHGGVSIYFP